MCWRTALSWPPRAWLSRPPCPAPSAACLPPPGVPRGPAAGRPLFRAPSRLPGQDSDVSTQSRPPPSLVPPDTERGRGHADSDAPPRPPSPVPQGWRRRDGAGVSLQPAAAPQGDEPARAGGAAARCWATRGRGPGGGAAPHLTAGRAPRCCPRCRLTPCLCSPCLRLLSYTRQPLRASGTFHSYPHAPRNPQVRSGAALSPSYRRHLIYCSEARCYITSCL